MTGSPQHNTWYTYQYAARYEVLAQLVVALFATLVLARKVRAALRGAAANGTDAAARRMVDASRFRGRYESPPLPSLWTHNTPRENAIDTVNPLHPRLARRVPGTGLPR